MPDAELKGMGIFTTGIISLIIIGVILLLSTVGTSTLGAINGSMAGYFLMGFGIFMLILYLSFNISNNPTNIQYQPNSYRNQFMSILYTSGPFVVLMTIIIFSLIMLFHHKSSIAEGRVAPGYVNFTNVSIILILIQLWIFYSGTKSKGFQNGRLDRVYSMLLYLVGIINIVAVITIWIILNCYSTDG
jgi:hypothetical protein